MDEPVNKTSPSDDEVHLLDYFIILVKHSRVIICASLAAVVLIYLILFLRPNQYKATTRILPPQSNTTLSAQVVDSLGISPASGGGGGGGGMVASMLGLKSPSELYVGMLTSNTIFDHIIQRFNLRDVYGGTYIEDIRKKLDKNARISAEMNGLIQIELTDADPKRAAEIANAFNEELDTMLQEISRKDAKDHLTFVEKERAEANQNLAASEEALRCFSEQTSVLQIDAQTKGMLEYIAGLRATIDAKEVQIKVMRQQATPANYDIIRLETELEGLKEKLRQSAVVQANTTSASDVCLPSGKVPTLGLEYFRLVRETKYREAIYQMYCKLVEMARMEVARTVPMVKIVDRASPPEKRSNKRLLPALIAGFAVFFLSVFGAFAWEGMQQMQQREEEIQRLTIIKQYLQPYKAGFIRLKNLVSFWKNYK